MEDVPGYAEAMGEGTPLLARVGDAPLPGPWVQAWSCLEGSLQEDREGSIGPTAGALGLGSLEAPIHTVGVVGAVSRAEGESQP